MTRLWRFLPAAAGLLLLGGLTHAAEPDKAAKARSPQAVAADIDRGLDNRLKEAKVPPSPAAPDAEFLRRAYLDLVGHIPTAEQAAAFLDSKDPEKRRKLIDELLDSPDFGKHFAVVWSDLIVKRDEMNRGLRTDGFKAWLAEGFNQDRGWDKTVAALLTAEGASDKAPETTFFLAHRDMDRVVPNKVVGTVANLFMGVQLQCAECHRHPFIRNWMQEDFWAVAAFFSQTRASGATGQAARNSPVTIGEGAAPAGGRGPGGFRGGPTLTGARIEVPDPVDPRKRTGKVVKAKFFEGAEPDLGDKAPFRPAFAEWLTAPDNKFFANAAVNRFWAHFFGKGFVNPLDEFSDGNPPSHPELLTLLADEFKASGFDLKHLFRCVCNTNAYARTSKPLPENDADTQLFSHMTLKVMNPEVLYDSLCLALGVKELSTSPRGGGRGFGGGPGGFGGGPRDQFVNFFTTKEEGDDPNEMGFGIPQFLRLMNSAPFNKGSALVERLVKDEVAPDKAIEAMYLAVLARRPTADEAKKLAAYVAKKNDPKSGYEGVFWVLLNSAEFVCNR